MTIKSITSDLCLYKSELMRSKLAHMSNAANAARADALLVPADGVFHAPISDCDNISKYVYSGNRWPTFIQGSQYTYDDDHHGQVAIYRGIDTGPADLHIACRYQSPPSCISRPSVDAAKPHASIKDLASTQHIALPVRHLHREMTQTCTP